MRSEQFADTGTPDALRARLRHVYWIGGGSGAGKSTVARVLADRYGLSVYSTDEVMADHSARRGPQHWFRGEGFGLIVEDLLRVPARPGVVAEGFRLLPRLVRPLLAVPRRAVWLLPTPDFRVYALHSGGSLWDIPNKTNDPPAALRNLLQRDAMFTERLRDETAALNLRAIDVDTTMTQDALLERMAEAFGLRPGRVTVVDYR